MASANPSTTSIAKPLFGDDVPLAFSQTLASQTDNPYIVGHWSQSLVIRLVLGLAVCLAVTQLLLRITDLILMGITPLETFWKSLGGFIVWQSVQSVGVFFGAMLAVAGRYQMMTLGVLLGLVVGFLTIMVQPLNPDVPTALTFFMPLWYAIASALGAWIGEMLWYPQFRRSMRSANAKLTQQEDELSVSQLLRKAVLGMIFANINWLRVMLAVVLILPTLWYATDAVNTVIIKTGLLPWVMESGLQKAWVATMIKIAMVILCGAMAGAGTTHGIAHGFWTGVICGVLNLLLHVLFPKDNTLLVDNILWEVGWVFVLSIVSGGFGALAIPPMMYLAQRRNPTLAR
ncbi:MAG: hypothetical protein U0796_20885 [Gemmatales bacterium]